MNTLPNSIIIYNTPDGKASVSLCAKDGNIWMNQNQLAKLFATSKQNVGKHIFNILKDGELNIDSVVKNYFTTARDGKEYKVDFYSLDMILAIGFRVRSKRGLQFRIWANKNLKEYMTKGFLIDDNRLKNPDGRPDYFDELLERIRDIRASEKRFYQKIRDLFALCSDYDSNDKSTQMFFAETQNKLHYAVTGKTAAELIVARANADEPNMNLTSWKGSVVRKQDVVIAKNYLTNDEIDSLNRLVIIFLESAELRVKNRKDLTVNFWRRNVDRVLDFQDQEILAHKGAISKKEMEQRILEEYDRFDQRRKEFEAMQADQEDLEELRKIEQELKKIPKK